MRVWAVPVRLAPSAARPVPREKPERPAGQDPERTRPDHEYRVLCGLETKGAAEAEEVRELEEGAEARPEGEAVEEELLV